MRGLDVDDGVEGVVGERQLLRVAMVDRRVGDQALLRQSGEEIAGQHGINYAQDEMPAAMQGVAVDCQPLHIRLVRIRGRRTHASFSRH